MRTLLNQGLSYLDEDRYEEGIDSFERALEEPESVGLRLPESGILVSRESVDTEVIKYSVADLISEIETEKEKAVRYEKAKSSVEDAEGILAEAETNVNQNRISEALDNVEELHSAVDNLPENVSKYDMKEEVREIKNRCEELIVELRGQFR
jgi:tetratricopeptide (TPR) repeat protein